MDKKLVNSYQQFLINKEKDQNKIIKNLFNLLNTVPVYNVNIPLIEDVEYNDIIKLWEYFKIKNPNYFEKKKIIVNTFSKEDEKKYRYYFNKFTILEQLFKAHILKDEHLILFHIKNSDYSLCKLHSENLWKEIYGDIDEKDSYKYFEFLSQIPFWNIEINTPNIKNNFLKVLNDTDINKCIHISCYCLD